MKNIYKLLFLCLYCVNPVLGMHERMGENPDRFEFFKKLQRITPEWLEEKKEESKKEQNCMGFEIGLLDFIKMAKSSDSLLEELEAGSRSIDDFSTRMLFHELQNFAFGELNFLEQYFPESIIPASTWSKLKQANAMIQKEKTKYDNHCGFLFQDSFYKNLDEAVQKLDGILEDEDTVVAIGNSPQFLKEAYALKGAKQAHLISVAISGWPGLHKYRFYSGIMTPQGLDNYRDYLKRMGLTAQNPKCGRGKLYFLDVVGAGKAIEFLVEEFLKTFELNPEVPCPDIHVLSINKLDRNHAKGKFCGKVFRIDNVSLDMPELTRQLDRVSQYEDHLRVAPDFPSWKWHDWVEPEMKPGRIAQIALDNFKKTPQERTRLPFNVDLKRWAEWVAKIGRSEADSLAKSLCNCGDIGRFAYAEPQAWEFLRSCYLEKATDSKPYPSPDRMTEWLDANLRLEELVEPKGIALIWDVIGKIEDLSVRERLSEDLKKLEERYGYDAAKLSDTTLIQGLWDTLSEAFEHALRKGPLFE